MATTPNRSSGGQRLAGYSGQYDEETIVVYQAYRQSISQFAIDNGWFGGNFKYSPMSWIKGN